MFGFSPPLHTIEFHELSSGAEQFANSLKIAKVLTLKASNQRRHLAVEIASNEFVQNIATPAKKRRMERACEPFRKMIN
jgi:hypothetical protein